MCVCMDCGLVFHTNCVREPALIINGSITCSVHVRAVTASSDLAPPAAPAQPSIVKRLELVAPPSPTGPARVPVNASPLEVATLGAADRAPPLLSASHKRPASPPSPSLTRATKLHRQVSSDNSLDFLQSSRPSSGSLSDEMGDAAPEWFVAFSAKLDASIAKINESQVNLSADIARISDAQSSLSGDLKALDSKISAHEAQTKAQIAELRGELHREVGALRSEFSGATGSSLMHQHDTCEVLLSGIPHDIPLNDEQIVKSLLAFLGLNAVFNLVLDWRPWRTANRSGGPSGSTLSTDANFPPGRSRGVVIRFASAVIRDKVASSAIKLRDKKCSEIFGSGGDANIFLRPLWPKQLYELFQKTVRFCRTINYARPIIRNLTVFARPDSKSALVPIHSERDLTALPPGRA